MAFEPKYGDELTIKGEDVKVRFMFKDGAYYTVTFLSDLGKHKANDCVLIFPSDIQEFSESIVKLDHESFR